MAIAIAFPGFNDLGRFGDPDFSNDESIIFLPIFNA